MKVCDADYTCLEYRSAILRRPPVFEWNSPCLSCKLGTDRATAAHKPEPETSPQPLRGAYKSRKRRVNATCKDCGKRITPMATRCKPCRGKMRTAEVPKKCTHSGCRHMSRHGGLCWSHWYSAKGPAAKESQRIAWMEATRRRRARMEASA
jgi:hypothetical protein